MTEIKEVKLPGLGVRYEFMSQEGKRVGVVSHRSGRKELYLAHPDDPDAFKRMLGLSDETRARSQRCSEGRASPKSLPSCSTGSRVSRSTGFL
jgi:K+/H+ antiporter YhaU regulatory subunit KhtT